MSPNLQTKLKTHFTWFNTLKECEDGIIEGKIVSDFSNTENGINGGWLN